MSRSTFRPSRQPAIRRIGRSRLLLGAATVAIALSSTAARADCVTTDRSTVCSGLTAGYVSSVAQATVNVVPAGTVAVDGVDAVALQYDAPGNLVVDGTVRATAGIAVGATVSGNYQVRVGEAGSIIGATAIAGTNATAYPQFEVDNAGRIEGTQGVAIETVDDVVIHNRKTGRIIGSVSAYSIEAENDGVMDGGSGAALNASFVNLVNGGSVTSAAATGAMINGDGITVENSGAIRATGGAAAIRGQRVDLVNKAGATIAATGDAIVADGDGSGSQIENSGAIEGNVVFAGGDDIFYQRNGGTVAGGVSLGAGNDEFWREQRGDVVAGGVTGAVDGGDGEDLYGIRLTQSGTVNLGALPTGFERHGVDLCGCDIDGTIAAGDLTGGLTVTGAGTLTNLANFTYSGSGAALDLANGDDYFGALVFTNRGTINAEGIGAQALIRERDDGHLFGQFVNEGTINFTGDYVNGISLEASGGFGEDGTPTHAFVNRGAINGSGASATTVRISGSALNSGTITATGNDSVGVATSGATHFENDATGKISGSAAGVLLSGGRLVNRGTIDATDGTGVSVNANPYYPTTIINEAGGVIRGTDAAIDVNVVGTSQSTRIANKGMLAGDVQLGRTNDVVWLAEGSTVQGDVNTGAGDDTIIVDITRVTPRGALDTSGIVTGAVDAGSDTDTLWLRSDINRTVYAQAAPVAGYESMVYEAAGPDTVLTLQGPLNSAGDASVAYQGLLRVAGDGKVVVDMPFNNGGYNRESIKVEQNSTASMFGDSTRGLDLVIARTVNGGTTGNTVDATYARRVELLAEKGGITFNGGVGLKTGVGTQVLLSRSTEIRKFGTDAGILLQSDHSDIVNRTTLREDGASAAALATSAGVQMTGGSFRNERADGGVGSVNTRSTAIEMHTGTVINDGNIVSLLSDAIRTVGYGTNHIINNSQGLIQGHKNGNDAGTAGAAIVGGQGNDIIENAGTITGDALLNDGNDAYIATGGKITGNLDMGRGNDNVLTRNGVTLDVTGTVAGGEGADAIGKSFVENGTFDLVANIIPAGFELHGVDASLATTEVTVTSATTQATGLRVFGDGKVTNTANFNIADNDAGINSAIEIVRFDEEDGPLLDLINTGTITSARDGVRSFGGLSSFTNSGAITAKGVALYIEQEDAPGTLTIRNTGSIKSSNDSAVDISAAGYDPTAVSVDFDNNGQIEGAGENSVGVDIDDGGYGITKFGNSGTIGASGAQGTGVRLTSMGRIEAGNAGTVEASGQGGVGMALLSFADPFGALTKAAAKQNPEDCLDAQDPVLVASLTNSGTIRANGGAYEEDGSDSVSVAAGVLAGVGGDYGIARVTNAATGLIEATGPGSSAVLALATDVDGYGSADIDAALRLFELNNAGTIRGGADTVIAAGVAAYGGDEELGGLGEESTSRVLAGGIQTIGTTDKIVNLTSGRIIGNVDLGTGNDVFENYGTLEGDLRLGAGDDTFVYAAASTFTGMAYGGEGSDLLMVDVSGTGSINFDQFRGFETLSQRGQGSITIRGTTDLATLTMAGSSVTVAAGTRFDTQGETALAGSDAAESVRVVGTIGGGISLGGGADVLALEQGGLVEGNVDMGDGDDRVMLAGGTVTGRIDGGAGSDIIAFDITGDTSVLPDVLNFESLDVNGTGTLSLAMNQDFDTVRLGGGANLTLNPGTGDHSIGNIVGDDTAQVVKINTQLTGGVSLGGGDDTLSLLLSGTLSGALDGGAGTDVLELNLTGASSITGGVTNFETINVAGSATLTLGATLTAGQTLNFDGSDNNLVIDGGSILGTVNGGAGRDKLTFTTLADQVSTLSAAQVVNFEDIVTNGTGTLAIASSGSFQTIAINDGDLTLNTGVAVASGSTQFGAGDNVLTLASGATLSGAIDGGAGIDRLVLNQGANEVRKLSSVNFSGFEQLESGDVGELQIDTNATFETLDLLGAKLTVLGGATLTVPTIAGGAGANTLDVRGTVAGNVDLGGGDDRLVLNRLDAITGTATGGAGTDTLEFHTAGTYAAPVSWNGQGMSGFEKLDVSAGVLSLTGDVNYDTVSVTGGRLIGQAGTSITSANTIVVSQGATFGTAGIVNGNIDVRGTLSPGASPGTMTVNGNVGFASGSNLLLEVAPTGSDLLKISGTLTVAAGATMDITGVLNATPGGALDLVVANGGITGGFTTINKSNTVFGFVATRGNKIQIVGEFQNNTAFGTNAQSSIAYANTIVGAGKKVQAFTGALPALVGTTGLSNESAFERLTPEAYATASQAGIDKGLTVTNTMRQLRYSAPSAPGFYGFGQAVGEWNRLTGDAVTGATGGRSDTSGLIGGAGYQTAAGIRVGAFVGALKTEQKLETLGATNKLEGMVIGAVADANLAGVGVHALLAYDGSTAKTRRSVPAGSDITSKYDVGGLMADFSVDYAAELGGMQVTPSVGVSYVQAERKTVTEAKNDFALSVAGGSAGAWFGDAGVKLSFDSLAGQGITPYLEAGVRHRLNDGRNIAIAHFADAPTPGSVIAAGADRDRTAGRLSAGFGADLAKNVRLNVGYSAEFADTTRHHVNGGITIGF